MDALRRRRRGAEAVLRAVRFESLLELLPDTSAAALLSVDSRLPCTHARLRRFVADELRLSRFGIGRNDRVAVLMPNGPELAVAFVAVITYCTCAPLNPASSLAEIREELVNVRAKAILISSVENNDAILEVAEELDLAVIVATPSKVECGLFELTDGLTGRAPPFQSEGHQNLPQGRHDVAMVLHTSGSTGKKKVVPYLLEDLLAGALCIAAACELEQSDICLNQMPLYHIGGIARNVLAPILSGGAVVAMPYFEPNLFWSICCEKKCTWYYAGPTMHMLILDAFKALPAPPAIHLRFIANAAGPLPPSIAIEMRDTYTQASGSLCCIMPSYGMTECMPISSPPVGYNLERPGTSGQIIGPRCQIHDDNGVQLQRGEMHVGHIMVQGHPVTKGYEDDPEANAASFKDGWFKTGDLGYMDEDGYLYITGRSKEVINRGGEIISPVEIEDALLSHPNVQTLVAFSTPHEILQETICICVVCKPGAPRVGLAGLQAHVAQSLHPSKWPQMLVYANDIPKTSTGKAMRVRLDKRMQLPPINDSTSMWDRLFEADMVPPGAPAHTPIPTWRLDLDLTQTSQWIKCVPGTVFKVEDAHTCLWDNNGKKLVVAYVVPESTDTDALLSALRLTLHEYLLPTHIIPVRSIPRTPSGEVAQDELPTPSTHQDKAAPESATEALISSMWVEVLHLDKGNVPSVEDDFFMAGGSSLLSSTLAAMIKKQFGIPFSGTTIFQNRTIRDIAELVDAHLHAQNAKKALVPRDSQESMNDSYRSYKSPQSSLVDRTGSACLKEEAVNAKKDLRPLRLDDALSAKSQLNPLTLLVQSLPFWLFHSVRRVSAWSLFVILWLWLLRPHKLGGVGISKFSSLIVASIVVRTTLWVVLPVVAIAFKWLIMGRYKAGRYALWGRYYLRWWLMNQLLDFLGRGVFDTTDSLRSLFFRLMGARIGYNCSIDKDCKLTEFDLVNLGDNVALDAKTIVSPFCVDGGQMMLSAIDIGTGCSVGTKSVIAPGAILNSGTCLPPLSSSHELADASPVHRKHCRAAFAQPPQWMKLLIGLPIHAAILVVKSSIIIAMIYLMTLGREVDPLTWAEAVDWFTTPRRLTFFFLIHAMRATLLPLIEFACVVLIKRLFIGRFEPGPCTSMWYRFRYWLMSSLCSSDLCGVAPLLGNHWGGVTLCMKLLGVTCGKRIFWPGSGLDIVEYDLLTIGDDVVFGSRSTFLCSNGEVASPIRLMAGSNVADRCVVCPGVVVGVNACLGTGSLAAPGTMYGHGALVVGSRGGCALVLDRGSSKVGDEAQEETIKPFGRRFYRHQGNATFVPWSTIPVYVTYVWFTRISAAAYRAARLPISIFLLDLFAGGRSNLTDESHTIHFHRLPYIGFPYYLLKLIGCYSLVNFVAVILALSISVCSKWLIIGKRQPGIYPWDTSSYCMQWQIYLSAEAIRRGLVDYLGGSAFIVWYFRALGCDIGHNVCLFPTGSDPMMTEPDLVKIGDGACINFSFLICHTNSKGAFALNKTEIGPRTTLRSFSRVMAGSTVEEGARLLEHTLVLMGETVETETIWQGWPAHDMINSDEYWGKRRQRLRLGKMEKKKKLQLQIFRDEVTVEAKGPFEKKILALEAKVQTLKEENKLLRKNEEEHLRIHADLQGRIDALNSKLNSIMSLRELAHSSAL